MNYYNYFTEIEEHFVRRRGRHLFVSPMDWSLMATWRDSGVPLHVALRGIDRAMDAFFAKQSHRESRVSTLFYCHAAVMEEYASHLEAHVGEDPGTANQPPDPVAAATEGPDKSSILAFLNERILEIKALFVKLPVAEGATDGIARLVQRLEEIIRDLETGRQAEFESLDRDLAILDEALVNELRAALPEEVISEWEREARKELKIYKSKLPKETYAKILKNFMRTKIHRHFALGELSLFHI
jgi:hypothetical protein